MTIKTTRPGPVEPMPQTTKPIPRYDTFKKPTPKTPFPPVL